MSSLNLVVNLGDIKQINYFGLRNRLLQKSNILFRNSKKTTNEIINLFIISLVLDYSLESKL